MNTKFSRLLLCVLLTGLAIASCSDKKQVNREAMKIQVEPVAIKRYEKALFQLDTLNIQSELGRIHIDFLPFLEADLTDTSNIIQIKNFITDQTVREIYVKTIETYPEIRLLEDDLTKAFKHIRYYFPEWNPPKVYSYVSGLNHETPVIYDGKNLIIALDMYLGEDFEEYQKTGIPMYRIKRMQREYIVADCAGEIIRSDFISETLPEHLLDKMIGEGRTFYLISKMIPWVEDQYITGFTSEDLMWCRDNESRVWAYFLENELLFNTDPLIIRRFVNDGPFTTAFHKDSPARVALWTGWQIVESFMKNNPQYAPKDLLRKTNSADLLHNSGYKPRRTMF